MSEGAPASARTSSAPDPLIGRTIDERYTITSLIARGGMGKVYRAEQAPLGRLCAVKVLQPSYNGEADPEFERRFFLEASISSKLTHPNTVTIFDYGRTDDGLYFMAMEYLEGRTLHKAIKEAGWFDEERTCHVAKQICRSLREAHGRGVIHRDLKPANVFLTEHGDEIDFVKVLDFGLVKNLGEPTKPDDQLTQTGLFMGSPKYMSPEQIQGERVDARADVYSLGIMMYEMLCGKVPFDRSNSVNILMAHVHERPPTMHEMNPGVQISPPLEDLVMRSIAKKPEYRPASMDEVLAALKAITGQQPGAPTMGYTGEYVSGNYKLSSYPPPPPAGSSQPPQPLIMSRPRPLLATQSSGGISAMGSQQADALRPSSSQPLEQPRSSRGIFVFAILVAALGLLGVAAFLAVRQQERADAAAAAAAAETNKSAANGPSAASAAAEKPVAPPASAQAQIAKVRIDSDPPGASVRENGVEICAATPCDVVYSGDDTDPIKEHRLTFSKGGYRSDTKSVRIADAPIHVKLSRASGGARPSNGQAQGGNASTTKPEGSSDALKGFKDVPY